MINHLKAIHHKLYLPEAPSSFEFPFKVSQINEPYLYTEASCCVDTFDSPNQSVKIRVSNVGGGKLSVERIRIPRAQHKWIRRGEKSEPVLLTATSDPAALELKLNLTELPNLLNVSSAELSLISNSKRKTFSKVLLRVCPPKTQSPCLFLPETINFGEITVWEISITDKNKTEEATSANFLLIGDFTHTAPTSIQINQIDSFFFHGKISTLRGELHYKLDLRNPGAVKPLDSNENYPKSIQQTVSIMNGHQYKFSGSVTTSDIKWVISDNRITIPGFSTADFSLAVDVETLKPGRNFGEIIISDKKVPIWAWLRIVHQTNLTLDQDQPYIHHSEQCSEPETPLNIDVVSTGTPYQSIMIFEDLDFHFRSEENDQIGYLLGDFNQWTPRALFLEKAHRDFGITLSIPEGTYLYRAEIDDEMRLDPTRLYEIVCCSHGLASITEVSRVEQKITLRNNLKRQIKLKLQSPTEWMHIEPEIIALPVKGTKEAIAIFQPQFIKPGLNLGRIQIETEEKKKRYIHASIFVMGTINGVVPLLRNNELAFPQVEQGKTEDIPLVLDVFGAGELKGEIQPSTVLHLAKGDLHIKNEHPFEPMEVTPPLQILTERPSNAYRKQIQASLVTDCYLANRRLLPFVAKYDIVHLVSDPPALYFPKVYLFDESYTTDITVKRSDGKDNVECSLEIPDELRQMGFITTKDYIRSGRAGQCGVVLNPQNCTQSGRFTGNLRIKDEKSGMSLPIQFAAEIIEGQAKIEVQDHGENSDLISNGIPLVITNIGKTELRIFDARFKNLRFYFAVPLVQQPKTLLPGESIQQAIKAKTPFNPFIKTVKDTLIVRLNDPQFPQGRFEKDLAVEIRGRF